MNYTFFTDICRKDFSLTGLRKFLLLLLSHCDEMAGGRLWRQFGSEDSMVFGCIIYSIVLRLDVNIGSEGWKNETKVGNVEVPNSKRISSSNSSLPECFPATQATQVRFPASRCSSRGWRWPWTSLFIEVIQIWFKNTQTCKYMIIPEKELASAIRVKRS